MDFSSKSLYVELVFVPVYILLLQWWLSIVHSNVTQIFLNAIVFVHWKHWVDESLMEFV